MQSVSNATLPVCTNSTSMNDNFPGAQQYRTPIIDILRGWALLSVVLMNFTTIYGWNHYFSESQPDTNTSTLETVFDVLFGSKGWTLLAVLFGFGFSALLQKTEKTEQSASFFFIRRMLWLFGIAFLNTLFFGGDILNDYALMGLILLLFSRLPAKMLYAMGFAILLLTPALQSYLGNLHLLFSPADRDVFYRLYNVHDWFSHMEANLFMRYKWMLRLSYSVILHLIQLGCFLIGMALHRSNAIEQIRLNERLGKIVFTVGLLLSVSIYFLQERLVDQNIFFTRYYDLFYPLNLTIMCTQATGILWIYLSGKYSGFFSALQATGKLTLTNYMIQNVFGFVVLICWKPTWPLFGYLAAGFCIFILQVPASIWWLRNYEFGPVEWLWRSLSGGQALPFQRRENKERAVS